MYTEAEKAYLAGLVDGEGHVGITLTSGARKGRWRTHFVILTIGMCAHDLIEGLAHRWAGANFSKGSGSTNAQMWSVRWGSASALNVLREIRPFLRLKGPQADLALLFADEMALRSTQGLPITEAEWNRREDLRIAVRELNTPHLTGTHQRYEFGAKAKEPLVCKQCGTLIPEYGTRKRQFCSQRCGYIFHKDTYLETQRQKRQAIREAAR